VIGAAAVVVFPELYAARRGSRRRRA